MTGVEDLGLVEVPASGGADRGAMAVILTGDGGWADIDKSVAAGLAAAGVPVVGWSSLRYYWTPRTPEAAARDLARIVEHYSAAWKKERVLLVGYSFGADVLPFLVNRLPAPALARIGSVSLLGLSDTAAFEFHVSSWLGGGGDTHRPTAPEVARLTRARDVRSRHRRKGLGLPGPEGPARPGRARGQWAPLRWRLRAAGRADPGSDGDALRRTLVSRSQPPVIRPCVGTDRVERGSMGCATGSGIVSPCFRRARASSRSWPSWPWPR